MTEVSLNSARIAPRDFKRLSGFIENELGIKMPDSKKTMLESRLRKRMKQLNIESFKQYCNFIFSPEGQRNELVNMIDVVTTNKTDFFREPAHFEYLSKTALPELKQFSEAGTRKRLLVWSAGCSYGDEPYTLAMVLGEFAEITPGFKFTILATDISSRALDAAERGIYKREKVEPVPFGLKKKYLLKSKNPGNEIVKIVPRLRDTIKFHRLNLMKSSFGIKEKFHIIFCRNVIIYFNKEKTEILLNKFYKHLQNGGYLFFGHSESITNLNVRFIPVAPTVYRKLEK